MTRTYPADYCPYRGLQPYTEEQREFFVGRERDQGIIASNLYAASLTVLYGASGVGKSSVLLAGVVPQVRAAPRVSVAVFREWQDGGFLAALKQVIVRDVSAAAKADLKDAAALPLDECLAQCCATLRGQVFVILDQFEEYFRYHPSDEFDAEFARAVNRRDVRASFLMSLREDELSRLDRFEGRIPNLLSNLLRLDHLNRESAARAIREPLERYNQLLPDRPPMTIEPELVQRLLDEQVSFEQGGQGQAGPVPTEQPRIETPFLQMVLTRLWNEERSEHSTVMRLKTLERCNGANGIVREHLDGAMAALTKEEQDVAARIFRQLVTPSGTKIAYLTSDLANYAELPVQRIEPIVAELSDQTHRILRPIAPPGGKAGAIRYEIFHDALAPAVLDWRRRFSEEQGKELAVKAEQARQEELRRVAQERTQIEQAEAQKEFALKRARRWRLLMLGASLAMVLFATMGGFALNERSKAFRLMVRSDSLAADATTSSLSAKASAEDARRERGVAEKQRAIAEQQRQLAEVGEKSARSRELAALSERKREVDPEESLSLAANAVSVSATDEAVNALRSALAESYARAAFEPEHGINAVAFSTDGNVVATASNDGVRLWSPAGELRRLLPAGGEDPQLVVFSPDGRRVATDGVTNGVRIWDVAAGREIAALKGHEAGVSSIAFSADGHWVVTGSADSTARVWNAETGAVQMVLRGHKGPVHAAIFSPDGSRVATEAADESGVVWDRSTGKSLLRLDSLSGPHAAIAFSPDGRYIVSEAGDSIAKLWDVSGVKSPVVLSGHTSGISAVQFSASGRHLLTASDNGKARLWSVNSYGEPEFSTELTGHAGEIRSAVFSPNELYVLTAGADNTARVWEVESGESVAVLRGHTDALTNALFSGNGTRVLTSSEDGTARLWHLSTTVATRRLRDYTNDTRELTISADGSTVAALDQGGTIVTWSTESGNVVKRVSPPSAIRSLALSGDGRYLATAGADSVTRVLDLRNNAQVIRSVKQSAPVSKVVLSADGHWVASGADSSATVANVATGEQVIRKRLRELVVTALAFAPDGRSFLASGARVAAARPRAPNARVPTNNPRALIWRLPGALDSTELRGLRTSISIAAYSPSSDAILTGSAGSGYNAPRIWQSGNGQMLREFEGHLEGVTTALFSPSGELLLIVSDEHPARIWSARSGSVVADLALGTGTSVQVAAFAERGHKVVTVDDAGTIRVLECDVCGSSADMLAAAAQRLKLRQQRATTEN